MKSKFVDGLLSLRGRELRTRVAEILRVCDEFAEQHGDQILAGKTAEMRRRMEDFARRQAENGATAARHNDDEPGGALDPLYAVRAPRW